MPMHLDLAFEMARIKAAAAAARATEHQLATSEPPARTDAARVLRLRALFRHFDGAGKEPAWPYA
ncbi:MAG: hypothetical protein ACT4OX_10115 [Actinomycetota bacterium]